MGDDKVIDIDMKEKYDMWVYRYLLSLKWHTMECYDCPLKDQLLREIASLQKRYDAGLRYHELRKMYDRLDYLNEKETDLYFDGPDGIVIEPAAK